MRDSNPNPRSYKAEGKRASAGVEAVRKAQKKAFLTKLH